MEHEVLPAEKINELRNRLFDILDAPKAASGQRATITQSVKIDGDYNGAISMFAGIQQHINTNVVSALRIVEDLANWELPKKEEQDVVDLVHELTSTAFTERLTMKKLLDTVRVAYADLAIANSSNVRQAALALGMSDSSFHNVYVTKRKKRGLLE